MRKLVIDPSRKEGQREIYIDIPKAERDKTAIEVSERRSVEFPKKVKEEAHRRIVEVAPEWKQLNMIADGVALLSKQVDAIIRTQRIIDPLTAQELRRKMDSFAAWAEISKIRSKSNQIEANPDTDISDDRNWE